MRMMIRARIPTESGNAAFRSGALRQAIEATMQELNPEAAYFTLERGARCGYMVYDMGDSSQMPMIAERLFQELGAEIDMTPVMNAEDLQKGLDAAGAGAGAD